MVIPTSGSWGSARCSTQKLISLRSLMRLSRAAFMRQYLPSRTPSSRALAISEVLISQCEDHGMLKNDPIAAAAYQGKGLAKYRVGWARLCYFASTYQDKIPLIASQLRIELGLRQCPHCRVSGRKYQCAGKQICLWDRRARWMALEPTNLSSP